MKYPGIFLIGFLILIIAIAGCIEPDKPLATQTAVPTPSAPTPTPALSAIPVSPETIVTSPAGMISRLYTSVPANSTNASLTGPLPVILNFTEDFYFGNSTKWKSVATVYRIWINDSYQWFSPDDNRYYYKAATSGKKYLFVFISMVDMGKDRAPLPQQSSMYLLYDDVISSTDPTHILPTKNPDSSPKVVRIAEVEWSKKRFDTEYVEDFGYSHGQRLGYINPGVSNAVDGYIIYEVPESLSPENAYLAIVMPEADIAVWKLG
jgi:hypothetical protein